MPDIRVAWWNLENLFDRSTASRPPALESRLRSELRGWTTAVRNRKLRQLASVIGAMFDGSGPDLLGVCEVENESVLRMLAQRLNVPGRDYRVVGHESPDARGIDVSFIVDRNVLEPEHTGHQVVVKRTATRDIFWVEFRVLSTGGAFVAVANHWPSRSAGQYESEPFRMLTGETASYLLTSLFDEFDVGDRLPVLLMGDFNDEPWNRSIEEYLLGSRDPGRVRAARSPILLNLMWPLMSGENPGTFLFGSDWNMLDQFLVTKGMLRNDSFVRSRNDSVAIYRPAAIQGASGRPRRFGRPAKGGFDRDGFSDHFPITMVLDARDS